MNIEDILDPGAVLVVHHLHQGNSTKQDRKGAKFYTKAMILDGTNKGSILYEAYAKCHPKDQPSRRLGRSVAVSRVLAAYATAKGWTNGLGMSITVSDASVRPKEEKLRGIERA